MSANLDRIRTAAVGVWVRDPDGSGSLRLDAELVAADGALDRLVGTVVALRDLQSPDVAPIADLIDDAGQIIVISRVPIGPSLAELIGVGTAGRPGLAAVLAAATDAGRGLMALHRAGITHGSVGLDTAIVTTTGTTLLNETGLAAALAGRTVTADDDTRAWAGLVRLLAYAWTTGSDTETAMAVGHAADRRGIDAAMATITGLDAISEALTTGRAALAALATRPKPELGSAPPPAPGPAAVPGSAATLLGRRAGAGNPRVAAPVREAGVPAPSEGDAVAAGGGQTIRFGPGVPSGPASGKGWGTPPTRPPSRRRRRAAVATLVTVALAVAVGGWLWWGRGGPLGVAGVSVSPSAPLGHACDVTVDIVGTIHTDGRGGVVTYQWLRNDGESSAVLRETVAPGTRDAQVHLHWSFSGQGTFPASATLSVIAPDPMSAKTDFTYSCP